MGHGRRIRPSADGLLLLILASPVLPWYGPACAGLNAFAASPGRLDLPAANRAGSESAKAALGVVLADASVHLNNQPVASGMAVFQGDVIQTGSTSGAVVNFRNGDSASLAENSEVALEWETSPTSLNLRQGVLVVQGSPRSAPGWTSVHVLGATVIVQGEGPAGEFPALCRIAALGRGAAVFNLHGHVEIQGAGAPFLLPRGKYAHLEARLPSGQAGGPQAPGQLAGHVSREIPEETVQRYAQTTQVPLKVQDAVDWEDVVRTLKNGRVQITLTDGSTLNVGARSELKVTKHDVASGQTVIEMTVGKMRADVVKITKPGGSFQVKTQTAVIGVVGTSLIVIATFNNTHVFCLEGLVTVSSLNPALGAATTLHAGQTTNVPRGGPPGGAGQASAGQVNTNISQTNIGGGAGGLGGAVSPTTNVLRASTAGASAGAAGASGAAIAAANSASSTLSTVSSTLLQTAATTNSATSSANSATAASNSTTTITNTITQSILSPSAPCGCQ